MNLRNSARRLLQHQLASYLMSGNFSLHEIKEFDIVGGLPTLRLRDGTTLSSFWPMDASDLIYSYKGLPNGFEKLLADYVLRYKYPHFLPSKIIYTGFLPRSLFRVHSQHLNTLYDLPHDESKRFLRRFHISDGSVILEAGPFIGFGTIQMSRMAGKSGKVISLEAAGNVFPVFRQNIESNKLENVISFRSALGSDDSTRTLFKDKKQANSIVSGVVDESSNEEVPVRSISSVMREFGVEPNLIVTTINGAEFDAFSASADYLSGLREISIIAPGWYRKDGEVIGPKLVGLFRKLGFNVSVTRGYHVFAFK